MKIFIWKKAAASAALLSLFACGDDSSSGSKTDVFSTKDDLPECTEKITGDTLYVESDSADYFCEDSEWIIVGDTTATDTTATDSLSSSSIADSLLSSSSVEVSSSSANPREVVGHAPTPSQEIRFTLTAIHWFWKAMNNSTIRHISATPSYWIQTIYPFWGSFL